MGTKHPGVDAYIDQSADFAKPILRHLRKAVHAGCPDVEETLKWGFPHFMHRGILCSMASFKAHCAFGFWKGKLMEEKLKGAKPFSLVFVPPDVCPEGPCNCDLWWKLVEGADWKHPLGPKDSIDGKDSYPVVHVCYGAASRDPARWERPDVFDPGRTRRPSLAFGRGAHVCLGKNLARTEIAVAIATLVERLPGLRLDPGAAPPRIIGLYERAPTAVPVLWG